MRGARRSATNSESEGRYHSNWLNMMYPRLKLARNLLTSDGVIFISIDDHEVENLKRVMLEVFGEDNFLAQLIWDKQHSQQQGLFKRYHEYVLVFARSASALGGIAGGDGYIEAGALKKISKRTQPASSHFPRAQGLMRQTGRCCRARLGTRRRSQWSRVVSRPSTERQPSR